MTRRSGPTQSDYVLCRTIGHSWDPVPAEAAAPYGEPFWLRCVRCTSVRMDFCTFSTGELIGRRYDYAAGYLATREFDEAVPTRVDYRRLLFAEHLSNVRRLRAIRSAG